MSRATEFIKEQKLESDRIRLDAQIVTFLDEMKKGLDGEKSSMLMIPTYVSPKSDLKSGRPILCVDAGGTNLRICTAEFDADGNFKPSEITRYIMPGVEKELHADEYFALVAEFVRPYLSTCRDICISFAYRTKITEDIDAEIIELTKEVKVRESGGRFLGREIVGALKAMGESGCRAIVINDTVAGSLSGRSEHAGFGAYTGTVLGTGSNSCYTELNSNIKKVPTLPPNGHMVINTEAGSYDKMPRTAIDVAFDATTINPGIGVAEKMTSGAYLGPLCGFTLRLAGAEGVFNTKAIEEMKNLTSKDVDDFLRHGEGLIEEFLVDEHDEHMAREIILDILDRAARLVALQMAGCAIKSVKDSPSVLLTIEGSTYAKLYGMKEGILKYLIPFLQEQGIEPEIDTPEFAILKGCLIAGLSTFE